MAYSKTDFLLSDGTDLIELFKSPSLSGLNISMSQISDAAIGAKVLTSSSNGTTVSVGRDNYGRVIEVSVNAPMPCADYPCSDSGDSCCNECDGG